MCYFRIWDIETGECKRIIEDADSVSILGLVSCLFLHRVDTSEFTFYFRSLTGLTKGIS